MKLARKHLRLIAVAVTCVSVGAGLSAIATAGAATGSSTAAKSHPRAARGPLLKAARRAVSGSVVVPTKTGFATVTFERGIVKSVNGQQLTLAEGTQKKTYRTITLTIPTGAKVRDNGKASALSNVTPGQRAAIVQAPKHTYVIARTPKTP